jgi:hypothetical protein
MAKLIGDFCGLQLFAVNSPELFRSAYIWMCVPFNMRTFLRAYISISVHFGTHTFRCPYISACVLLICIHLPACLNSGPSQQRSVDPVVPPPQKKNSEDITVYV